MMVARQDMKEQLKSSPAILVTRLLATLAYHPLKTNAALIVRDQSDFKVLGLCRW